MSLFSNNKPVENDQHYSAQRRLILNPNTSFHIQEAYNTLRINIRFVLPGTGCKCVCLTSGNASEGKSTTILNLAISFAETGNKVLLIDGDMRRPSLARLLIEKASPGLSDVLAGLSSIEDGIRHDVRQNLDVLFSGEIPPNPLELLGSDRMKELIATLSEKYNYILIDTPPIGVVADACEVANVTQGVLFLVHQNETDRDAIQRGLKQLEMSNAKLLGFIINGVVQDNRKGYRYKYRYKYRYGYRYGYKRRYASYAYRSRNAGKNENTGKGSRNNEKKS